MRTGNLIGLFGIAAAFLGGVAGCDSGPGQSLYDPDRESGADPVISNVEPAGSAFAGVDVVTVAGQNFSTTLENNLVFFGKARGEVLEASASALLVLPPNEPAENAEIKIAVIGAENFSNSIPYKLEAAVESFGDIAAFEEPFGMTTDADGNLVVSIFSDGRSIGIIEFAPDGSRRTWVQTTFKWDGLAFGTDGMLYAVRGLRAAFRFAEGGAQEAFAIIEDQSVKLSTITLDASGDFWTGGDNENLYRIAADGSITEFPFEADVTDLAVADGVLYATATKNDVSSLWRFPIDANGGIGSGEQVANITAQFDAEALSIAVAASGEILVGTDADDPIVLVQPDGSAEALYPGILQTPAFDLAWGLAPFLYMNKAKTRDANPNLFRINTRREGAVN
ncbi:MAG TPA: IPT/TIG domain-containing protein [Rhodothermales bacterium]|nr:IPT/TIG domain-containing protein [Rhodothermales bacterium]